MLGRRASLPKKSTISGEGDERLVCRIMCTRKASMRRTSAARSGNGLGAASTMIFASGKRMEAFHLQRSPIDFISGIYAV